MTLCKDCEHFKIVQQPIKGFDWGMAECTKYNLVVDFADRRKFKWLSCENRPKHKGRRMTREETIKWLKSLKAEIGKSEHRSLWHYAEAIDKAIEALEADRPRGEWLIHGEPPMYVIECSQCGQKYFNHALQEKSNFCSNCGAKMDGERGE